MKTATGVAPVQAPDGTTAADVYPAPSYVPLVGRIAAGGPILAEQAVADVFPPPRQLVGGGDLVLLGSREVCFRLTLPCEMLSKNR